MKDVTFILAVVLLLPPAPCPGDAVFRCESESTLFGIQKRTQLEMYQQSFKNIHFLIYTIKITGSPSE